MATTRATLGFASLAYRHASYASIRQHVYRASKDSGTMFNTYAPANARPDTMAIRVPVGANYACLLVKPAEIPQRGA